MAGRGLNWRTTGVSDDAFNELANQLAQLEEELKTKNKEIKELNAKLATLEDASAEASSLKEKVAKLEEEKTGLLKQVEEIGNELKEMKQAILDERAAHSEEVQKLDKEIAELKEEAERLRVLESENADMKTEIAGVRQELEENIAELENARETIASQQQTITSLKEETALLEEIIEMMEAEGNPEEVKRLKSALEIAQKRTAAAEAETVKLTAEAEKLAASLNETKKLLAGANMQRGRYQSLWSKAAAARDAARADLKTANAKVKELEKKITSLETQITTINSSLAAKDAEIASLTAERDALKNERDDLLQKIAAKEQEIDGLKKRIEELEDQNLTLFAENQKLQARVQELINEVAQVSGAVGDFNVYDVVHRLIITQFAAEYPNDIVIDDKKTWATGLKTAVEKAKKADAKTPKGSQKPANGYEKIMTDILTIYPEIIKRANANSKADFEHQFPNLSVDSEGTKVVEKMIADNTEVKSILKNNKKGWLIAASVVLGVLVAGGSVTGVTVGNEKDKVISAKEQTRLIQVMDGKLESAIGDYDVVTTQYVSADNHHTIFGNMQSSGVTTFTTTANADDYTTNYQNIVTVKEDADGIVTLTSEGEVDATSLLGAAYENYVNAVRSGNQTDMATYSTEIEGYQAELAGYATDAQGYFAAMQEASGLTMNELVEIANMVAEPTISISDSQVKEYAAAHSCSLDEIFNFNNDNFIHDTVLSCVYTKDSGNVSLTLKGTNLRGETVVTVANFNVGANKNVLTMETLEAGFKSATVSSTHYEQAMNVDTEITLNGVTGTPFVGMATSTASSGVDTIATCKGIILVEGADGFSYKEYSTSQTCEKANQAATKKALEEGMLKKITGDNGITVTVNVNSLDDDYVSEP